MLAVTYPGPELLMGFTSDYSKNGDMQSKPKDRYVAQSNLNFKVRFSGLGI